MPEAIRPVDPNSAPIAQSQPVRQDSESEADIKYCKELMSQGKAARQEVDGDWQKRLDYYNGKQWGGGKTQTYGSKPVMNIIRQTIQAILPILTDQRPGFAVLPKEPSDFDFANMMSELIEAYWDNYSMDHTLLEVLMDEMQLDGGIMKVVWDPSLEQGAGDIRIETVSPFDIYVPYGAVDFTKSCPWVLQRSTKTVAHLKEQFPEFKDKIKADQSSGNSETKANIKSDDIKLVSPTDQYSPPGMGGGSGSSEDLRKTCEVWEIWTDDTTYEEVMDKSTGEKVTKKKFPMGCLITVLPNQNLRLQKVANPYAHGRWPYVRFVDHIMPRAFWGEGESKVLMQTQRALNKTLKNIFDYLNLMSNPTWVIDEESGVDPDSITNQIAQVITTRSGGIDKIKRDIVPAIQPGTFDLYSLMVRQSEMISGMSEVSQGRKPPDVSSGVAIESLQEAAQTRIRLKERNMQVALQQLGYQMICLMCQYYTEPRVSRITGKDDSWPRYFEFFIEPGTKPNSYKLNKKEYQTADGKSYVPEASYTTTQETKGPMDVKVMSGTAMPWSKASRANIAFRLYEAQAIGVQDLLEALEWPNAAKIAETLAPPPGAGPEGMPPPPGGAEGQPPPLPAAAGG